jgi:hypothetical protein
MMKRITLFVGFLLLIVLLGGWTPVSQQPILRSNTAGESLAAAAAGDPELTINNQTGQVFYVTLTGPQTYTIQVAAGKNKITVVKGEYTLSYFACGAQQTKTVNVKKSGASIKLVCETEKKGKTPKLTIDNKTGPLYVTLTGPKTYSFYAQGGKTAFEVEEGEYEVSYFACGAQTKVTVNVKKKGATLKIVCIQVTFFNLNKTSSVGLTLSGPASYYFNLPPGKTTVQIVPGTYNYKLSGPCSFSGTVTIKKKGTYGVYCFSG